MSNNKSIQILRSNSSYDTTTSTEKLLDGQPYISKQLNKLMFGDGTKTLTEKYNTESSIDLHPNLENSEGQYSLRMPYYGENTNNLYFPSRAEKVLDEDGKEDISFGVALGLSNILRGQYSLVTGRLNTDAGANNLTGGLYNEVYQNHNITSGQQNKNYGKRSLVVGYQNILGTVNSSPEGNIVAGQLNQNITGHFNIISGQSHPQISGESNIVFGQGNTVTSNHNLVGGYGNSVTNERCLVMGSNNTVGKAGNFVFGQNITAKGTAYQTLIGKNFSADDKSLLMVGKDTPLFYIQENQSRFINELVVQNTIRTSNSRFKVSLTGDNTIETVGNIKCNEPYNFIGNLKGNASTATEFNSVRTIALTGTVTGSATSDGNPGWSIITTCNSIDAIPGGDGQDQKAPRFQNTNPIDYHNKLIFQGLKQNTAIDNPTDTTYSYLIGLSGWSDKSGGGSHELAFNDDGIFTRKSSSASDTWGDWSQLMDSSNYTSFCDERYVNVTGDSMTGKLTLSSSYGYDSTDSGALDLQCSNIMGLNGLYFGVVADGGCKGLNFLASSGREVVHSLYANGGGTLLYEVGRGCSLEKQAGNGTVQLSVSANGVLNTRSITVSQSNGANVTAYMNSSGNVQAAGLRVGNSGNNITELYQDANGVIFIG